ncbi:MAG: VWA domain-containing protein [Polyangiaceae bacterium]|nr:VWA domain-containing protein [Polyangiaceae bacterium]
MASSRRHASLLALSLSAVLACSPGETATTGGSTPSGGGGSGGSTSTSPNGGGGASNTGGNGFGGLGTGGSGGFAECAGVSSTATAELQPADIIIAVDTSGSMDEESAEVQQNLNTFASLIVASGIDVHVVLIADAGVCIPAPLGSGQCGGADESLPAFRHVVQTVSSSDSLQVMLNTYPQWSASLRPEATKTLAVVSDDDSSLDAASFTSQLLALDPTFQGFKFDAIVSSTGPDECIFGGCFFNCGACQNPCCDQSQFCQPFSAEEGTVYKQLVQQTTGVFGDLCSQDFGPVFQDMATAVVQASQLSCEYDIPPPPEGETLDPGLVNVRYTPGSGDPATTIYNVPGGAGDCGAAGGWYYDDLVAPTQIIVCPTTCATLQGDANGQVDVLFGCETDIVPR